MAQVRISDIVAQPHLVHFNSNKTHQLVHGGAASFKSSKNGLKIALKMLEDRHCETIVTRNDYTDHKDTTFAQLIWAFKYLGVPLEQGKHYPDGNQLWIKLPQGNYVHFKQMKKIDKLKGTKPRNPNNQIKIVWHFEITEYKNESIIHEANARFIREKKDYMWFIYEWNDHPKPSHWTYTFKEKMSQRDDTLVYKTTYLDTPKEQLEAFLGELAIKEIERLKQIDIEQYKSTYLALPANLSGGIYKLFNRHRHVKQPTQKYIDIWVGVDYGSNDATVFTATGVKPGFKGIEAFKYYKHQNGKDVHIKTINDYRDDLLQFCQEIFAQFRKPIEVHIDPANLSFKHLIEQAVFQNKYKYILVEDIVKRSSDKNKSSVQERIDLTEIMFGADFLTISPECKGLIKAIEEAEYNDKNERADDGRSDINSLDSFEYSWLKEKKIIKEMILG